MSYDGAEQNPVPAVVLAHTETGVDLSEQRGVLPLCLTPQTKCEESVRTSREPDNEDAARYRSLAAPPVQEVPFDPHNDSRRRCCRVPDSTRSRSTVPGLNAAYTKFSVPGPNSTTMAFRGPPAAETTRRSPPQGRRGDPGRQTGHGQPETAAGLTTRRSPIGVVRDQARSDSVRRVRNGDAPRRELRVRPFRHRVERPVPGCVPGRPDVRARPVRGSRLLSVGPRRERNDGSVDG